MLFQRRWDGCLPLTVVPMSPREVREAETFAAYKFYKRVLSEGRSAYVPFARSMYRRYRTGRTDLRPLRHALHYALILAGGVCGMGRLPSGLLLSFRPFSEDWRAFRSFPATAVRHVAGRGRFFRFLRFSAVFFWHSESPAVFLARAGLCFPAGNAARFPYMVRLVRRAAENAVVFGAVSMDVARAEEPDELRFSVIVYLLDLS